MPEHSTKRPEEGLVRPWLKHYPAGLSWDAPIATCPVQRILDDAVAAYPARVAIEFEGRAFTYAELGGLADRAAQGLRALGVAPGVHVGLYLPNTPHYALAFFAVPKAGGPVVNFPPLDAADVVPPKIPDRPTENVIPPDPPAPIPPSGAPPAGCLAVTACKAVLLRRISGLERFCSDTLRVSIKTLERAAMSVCCAQMAVS